MLSFRELETAGEKPNSPEEQALEDAVFAQTSNFDVDASADLIKARRILAELWYAFVCRERFIK